MKFTRWICLLLTVFLLFGLSAVPAFAEEEEQPDDPSVSRGCRTVDGMSPLYGSEKLLETAEAAMLISGSLISEETFSPFMKTS